MNILPMEELCILVISVGDDSSNDSEEAEMDQGYAGDSGNISAVEFFDSDDSD